jgi:N-acetylmuramoyl-L-alanine amidase
LCLLACFLLACSGCSVALPFAAHSDVADVGNRDEFASRACVAYDPTGDDRHITVFVDSGHGGPDPGAIASEGNGDFVDEKTATLAVGLDLLSMLRARGYHVVMSRTTDSGVARLTPGALAGGAYTPAGEHADVAARAHCANQAGADLLLSIHFDSYDDPTVGGVETLYDPDRPFSAKNRRFAGLVQTSVLKQLAAHGWQVPDRGVTPDTGMGAPALTSQAAAYGHLLLLGPASPGWFNRPTTMPGALCEPLFITDPGEQAVAMSKAGQKALATGFADAIDAYFARTKASH